MSLGRKVRNTGQYGSETDLRPPHAVSFETHDHLIIALSGVALFLLLILVTWLPAGAQSRSQPPMQGVVVDRPAPPMAMVPQPADPGAKLLPVYPLGGLDLRLPPPARRDGWGLVASVGGPSTVGDWAYNPAPGSGDLEVGLAWRRGDTSAVVGYNQFDRGHAPAPLVAGARPKSSRGVLGFSAQIKFP